MDTESLANMEYNLQVAARVTNSDMECVKYMVANKERLLPIFVKSAEAKDEDVDELIAKFMFGVHRRHASGLPLS